MEIVSFAQDVQSCLDGNWSIDPIHAEKVENETSLTREDDQFSVIIGTTDDLIKKNQVYVHIPKKVYGVPDRPNQRYHTLTADPNIVAEDITEYDPAENY